MCRENPQNVKDHLKSFNLLTFRSFIFSFFHFLLLFLHPQIKIVMRYFSKADLAKILNKDIFLNISEVADSLGVEC